MGGATRRGRTSRGVARIVNKSRRLVPLIASPWQLEFDELLEGQRAAGQPMRAIVLKARQLGFSTWTEAKITQRLTMLPYQNAVVVAHRVKAAGAIFEMARRMHSHLPSEQEIGLGFSVKPDIIGKSFSENGRKYLQFGEQSVRLRTMGRDGSSVLDIDTAESPDAVRGETKNLVHLSEFAKWPERATQGMTSKMASVLNAVPYEPETLVVLEFTANGLNHAYRRWQAAKEGAGDPMSGETYLPLFVPWWREPAYQMAFHSPEARQDFIDRELGHGPYGEDEEMLSEVLGLTPEQLLWRRMQIRTQHGESLEASSRSTRRPMRRRSSGRESGVPGDPRGPRDQAGRVRPGACDRDVEGWGVGGEEDARRDDRGPDPRGLGARRRTCCATSLR
jgi:hypothetical protein